MPRWFSSASFYTLPALIQKLIGILPLTYLFQTCPFILNCYFIFFARDNLSKLFIHHGSNCQLADCLGSGMVGMQRQPVTVFPLLIKPKFTRQHVHMGDECLVKCFLCLFFLVSLNDFADGFSHGYSCIVSTWKHEGIQEIIKHKKVSNLQVCRCTVHLGSLMCDSDRVLFWIDCILFTGQ